jgi:hypothetical protein
MTTDRAARVSAMTADERAARLAALQQRRAPGPTARGRRRHAAAGARILAGSISAATGLVLMGAMADSPTNTTATPASHVTGSSAPNVIVVPRGTSNATSPAAPSAPPSAPLVTAGTAPPITTSQGS